jgi:hypothetical protein
MWLLGLYGNGDVLPMIDKFPSSTTVPGGRPRRGAIIPLGWVAPNGRRLVGMRQFAG